MSWPVPGTMAVRLMEAVLQNVGAQLFDIASFDFLLKISRTGRTSEHAGFIAARTAEGEVFGSS